MVATNGNSDIVNELINKYQDIDPWLITKWERIFTMFFDRNCSNNLDSGDFYLIVRKVREVYGSESVQINYARKSLEALWKGLCKVADTNKDNLISLEEWVLLLRKVCTLKEKQPKWLDDYQIFMFKLFDVSGDGVLDEAEYADGLSLYGFKYQECLENYKNIALDKNGKVLEYINPNLWKTLFTDLFFSTDKKRPGNLLFGKSLFTKGSPEQDKSLEKADSLDKSGFHAEKSAQLIKSNSQQ